MKEDIINSEGYKDSHAGYSMLTMTFMIVHAEGS